MHDTDTNDPDLAVVTAPPDQSSTRKPPAGEVSIGDVLSLPGDRHRVFADLKNINRQCFLMVSDMQRGMLAKLAEIPGKLILAAENILRYEDGSTPSSLWSETLTLYAEALEDSREQILAAGRLHAATREAQSATEAIASITNILPAFLSAAAHPLADEGHLLAASRQLGESASKLDTAIFQLRDTVQRAATRAKTLDPQEHATKTQRVNIHSPKSS